MSRKYFIRGNEFAIIVGGKIEEKGDLTPKNLLRAFRSVFQRYYGIPDNLVIDDWIKEFSKPIGWDKYVK